MTGDLEFLHAERDFCLRSLADLDAEREAGDIEETDYHALRDSYTIRAAAALRALDGLGRGPGGPGAGPGPGAGAGSLGTDPASRHPSTTKTTPPSAESDLHYRDRSTQGWARRLGIIAGAALIAAGACWAVVASSATRLPRGQITGQALGSEAIAQQLMKAQQASGKGDALGAIKDYQKVLAANPDQPEALAGEGWLLAQTQQPALLRQGLDLLAAAEKAAPEYAPAHVYRGISLLSEDDYAGAIPELQWYLGHNPDPQLAPGVRLALQQAEAKARPAAP